MKSYKEMDWFLKTRGVKLERIIFDELMDLLRLNEKAFCDNIFYMFDEDKDNVIDFKEMVLGLKIFSQESYFTKMGCNFKLILLVFIDLCARENLVDIEEFFRILKLYIINRNDAKNISIICKLVLKF